METFFTLRALCAGNSPVTGEFPSQRLVTRRFDVFFDLCLHKRLSKQFRGWWFETPSSSLWRHCNDQMLWKCHQRKWFAIFHLITFPFHLPHYISNLFTLGPPPGNVIMVPYLVDNDSCKDEGQHSGQNVRDEQYYERVVVLVISLEFRDCLQAFYNF